MSKKLSSSLMICGCGLILVGLCLLPAAHSNKDQSLLGAGMCAIAFGALWLSGAIYLKASAMKAELGPGGPKPETQPARGGCDLCGNGSPVIHCRVHQLHICGECVTRHYDFRSCVYVPSTRRQSSAKPTARAARAGR